MSSLVLRFAAYLAALTTVAAPASAFTITFSELSSPTGPLVSCNPDPFGRCSSTIAPDPLPNLKDLHVGNVPIFTLPEAVSGIQMQTAEFGLVVSVLEPGSGAFSDGIVFVNADGTLDPGPFNRMILYSIDDLAFLNAGHEANFRLFFATAADIETSEDAAGRFQFMDLSGNVYIGESFFSVELVPGPIAGAGLPGVIVAAGAFFGWLLRRKFKGYLFDKP
jgi:hypothetical protein